MPEYNVTERILSATVGSLITSLVVTPLDVVKVRLQSQNTNILNGKLDTPGFKVNGTRDALQKIARHEGIRFLYRGLTPTLLMSVPSTVIYFLGYEELRNKLSEFFIRKKLVSEDKTQMVAPLLAGGMARILAATTISPIELLRTKMQYHGYHGSLFPVIRLVITGIKEQGLGILWRGLVPTLWRDVPFSAIYWLTLESLRSRLRPVFKDALTENHTILSEFGVSFCSGAMAGILAASLTTPFDVAKTRRQVVLANGSTNRNDGLISQLRQIVRQEGWSGLTRGMVPRCAKVAPACAIMIGSYELGKVYWKKII